MKLAVVLVACGIALTPATALASSSCVEKSDVLGDRACSRYGDTWATEKLPPIVVGFGLFTSHLSPMSRNWSGSFGKDAPIKFPISPRAFGLAGVDDVGFDLRMHGYVKRHLYVGFDWALAFGAVRTNLEQQSNVELANAGGVNFFHTKIGGIIGVSLPLGPVTARLESNLGFELASITAKARRPGQQDWVKGSFTTVNALLEPRVAVDLWTSSWTTVTGWGGINMLYPSERSVGLSVALHARAFDGARD